MAEKASGLGRCADGRHDDRRRRRPSAALLIRGRRPGPVAPRRTILAHLRREGCCPRACLSTSRRSKRGRHSIAPRITGCVKLRLGVSFWTTAALRVAGPRVRELGSRHASNRQIGASLRNGGNRLRGTRLLNADERNLGLPDVTVTAPPIIPSWKKWMAIYARNFQTRTK
jgi:hypothetical protein